MTTSGRLKRSPDLHLRRASRLLFWLVSNDMPMALIGASHRKDGEGLTSVLLLIYG